MYQILDGGTRHFFTDGWLSFWGDDCGGHRLIVVGPYGREPSFCDTVGALVISVQIGVDMNDKVTTPPANTRTTRMVKQIDQIDGGAWAGNGEGDKKYRPSLGALCRSGNRAFLLERKALMYENSNLVTYPFLPQSDTGTGKKRRNERFLIGMK